MYVEHLCLIIGRQKIHKGEESWAVFGQWYLMCKEYEKYIGKPKEDGTIKKYQGQKWDKEDERKDYSPLFIDLYDDENQNEKYGKKIMDKVSGYDVKMLDDSIPSFRNINDVYNYTMENIPYNQRNEDVRKLFEYYKKVW